MPRDTFAFQPNAPVQGQSGKTGQSRGAQIVGGQSQGGAVAAGPQTDPGPMAGQLGEFFGELMKPYVERKQQEKFFEGFTAAASGKALSELSDSRNPVTKIFGPSSFAEGAQFYTARKAVTDYSQTQLANMDELKKLDPAEVPKRLAEQAQATLTGDPYADQLIQRSLIEQAGPLVDTIAKKRVEWQQQEAVRTQQEAWGSAASNLQATMDAQADVTDPADPRRSAASSATGNFLGLFVKPEGMTEESYKKGLMGFLRNAAQTGNFHAITALRKAGIDGIFDDDESAKLETLYHSASQRVMGDAAMNHLGTQMDEYEQLRAKGRMTPAEAMNRIAVMNSTIRARTGVDEDMFDFGEVRGEVRSMMSIIVANHHRAEDRKWQLEDRDYVANQKAAEDAEETAAVGAAWRQGDVNAALAGGLPSDKFNQLALRDFSSGNLAGLTNAFKTGQWVSPAVRDRAQAMVAGSIDQQYGENFERAHQQWQAMVKANPGMAASYYGDWHLKMRAFDMVAKQLGPAAAFKSAFGDTAQYGGANVPPEKRKEAREAIAAAVKANQPGRLSRLFGAVQMNQSALNVIQGIAGDRVAINLQHSDAPAAALAAEAITAARADGSLQVAGEFAWRAAPGTKPFHTQLGLQQDEAGNVFRQVVDARLKSRGFAKGVEAEGFTIAYAQHSGVSGVQVIAHSTDGAAPAPIFVPMADFKAQQVKNMNSAVRFSDGHNIDQENLHRQVLARGMSLSQWGSYQARSHNIGRTAPLRRLEDFPVKYPMFLDQHRNIRDINDHYFSKRK